MAKAKKRVFQKRIALLFFSFLFGVVLFEFGFRLYASGDRLSEYTPGAIRERYAEAEAFEFRQAHKNLPDFILHPYFGAIERPRRAMRERPPEVLARQIGQDQRLPWADLKVNNIGFSSPYDIPYAKKENDYVVVMLGGSVARWLVLHAGDQFKKELEASPKLAGKNVVIINCANEGYKQPQQLMVLASVISLGLEPDAIINIDGFNEAALAYENAVKSRISPQFPHAPNWAHNLSGNTWRPQTIADVARYDAANKNYLLNLKRSRQVVRISRGLGYFLARRAEYWERQREEAKIDYFDHLEEVARETTDSVFVGPWDPAEKKDPVQACLNLWTRGTKFLATFAKGAGIHYLHVLQPTSKDTVPEVSKPLSEEELLHTGSTHFWPTGIQALYPRMRHRSRTFEAEGINFADLSMLFKDVTDTLYIDVCHYNQRGNESFSHAIAEKFLETLPADPIVR